jgi:hypothetical protein
LPVVVGDAASSGLGSGGADAGATLALEAMFPGVFDAASAAAPRSAQDQAAGGGDSAGGYGASAAAADPSLDGGQCIEEVEVSVTLLHPCLQDITIAIAGPTGPGRAPAAWLAPSASSPPAGAASGALASASSGNSSAAASAGRLSQLLSTASFALLFAGGAGEGSAGPGYACGPADAAAYESVSRLSAATAAAGVAAAGSAAPASSWQVDVATLPHSPITFADSARVGAHRCCAASAVDAVLLEEAWPGLVDTTGGGTTSSGGSSSGSSSSQASVAASSGAAPPLAQAADGSLIAPRYTALRGRFKPLSSLRQRFGGLRAAGLWTLRVQDRRSNGLSGAVLDWAITTRTRPCRPQGRWRQLALPPAAGTAGAAAAGGGWSVPAPRADAVSAVHGGVWYLWGGRSRGQALHGLSVGGAGGSVGMRGGAAERVWRFEPSADAGNGVWVDFAPLRPSAQALAAGYRHSFASATLARLFAGRPSLATASGAGGGGGSCAQDSGGELLCWLPALPGGAARGVTAPSLSSRLARWSAVRQQFVPLGPSAAAAAAAGAFAGGSAAESGAKAGAGWTDAGGWPLPAAGGETAPPSLPGHRSRAALAVHVGPRLHDDGDGEGPIDDGAAGSAAFLPGASTRAGAGGSDVAETVYVYGGEDAASGVILGDLWAATIRRL